MSTTAELRTQIDAAIAAGHSGRALSLVKQLWARDSSLTTAPFVIDRIAKIPDAPPAIGCEFLILRSYTVEPIVPLARAAAACWGLDLRVRLGQFNAYVQEVLDPKSTLYRDPTDVVALAVQTRDVAPELWTRSADLDEAQLATIVERVTKDYRTWVEIIRSRSAAHVVIHNLELPSLPAAGIYDAQRVAGQVHAIDEINAGITRIADEVPGVHLLDYDGLVARHGRLRWHDEQKWLTARLPIAAESLIHLANEWLRFLLPLRGRQAKCLVCDLDNTLWGGVIGEDGLQGIKLGGDYPGAAYTELQRAILDLARRGVILALCSKNNEADALEAIDQHPNMLLRRKDFAAMRINWVDKVQNLRDIATELNIGINSLVLIDDNPVEREFVREMIPAMAVIDIDAAHPLSHAAALRNCPLFERLEISAEDRQRGELYAAERERRSLESSATTIEDYYRSLEMVATFGEVDASTCQRVAQLTQKTNQLNMTTRRYSEQEIQAFGDARASRVYWVRVADRFGDNGIVGVMITRDEGADWLIDTFLMSCRVIGRTVETAMLGLLVDEARRAGAQRLVGPFIATAKNAPAKEIYASHGFECTNAGAQEATWVLNLSSTTLTIPEWIECRLAENVGVNR